MKGKYYAITGVRVAVKDDSTYLNGSEETIVMVIMHLLQQINIILDVFNMNCILLLCVSFWKISRRLEWKSTMSSWRVNFVAGLRQR